MFSRLHSKPVLSPILSGYLGRRFTLWLLGSFLVVAFVIYLIELVDVMRRASDSNAASLSQVAMLSGFRVPSYIELSAPILVVVAAVGCFWWMTRSHEFTVMRATGTSFFQFARPMFLIAFAVGIVIVLGINPVAVKLSKAYDVELAAMTGQRPPLVSISNTQSGYWLGSDYQEDKRVVLRAKVRRNGGADSAVQEFRHVEFFILSASGELENNVTARQAVLTSDGSLSLFQVSRLLADGSSERLADQTFQTGLTQEVIADADQKAVNNTFWELLAARANQTEAFDLESADGRRASLNWHKQLSLPFLLISSVCLAAVFSLRMARKGKTGILISGALVMAVAVQLLRDILYALGLSGRFDPWLAAWGPVILVLAGCLLALSYSEDG